MPSRPSHSTLDPNAAALRHRAATLRSFAGTIDQLLVTRIDENDLVPHDRHAEASAWHVRRHMLDRNLHQLHRAADELRDAAHQMWQSAEALELARTGGVRAVGPT